MNSQRTFLLSALALAASGIFAVPVAAQQVIKMTAAAGHPPVFLWVKMADEVLIPEVDKRLAVDGKYKIEWTKAWGGTLLKLGSESKGVADGVADVAIVSTVFEGAKFPLQNISYYTPFGTDDIGLVSKTVTDLQVSVPAMGATWTKNGLVYLGGMALDSYHVWSKFPITKLEDLKGKKLSAPGPSSNWVRGTGAVAVAGTLNSYYEDIKSGVSDGALVFTTGAWSAKLHEVAPYVTKVNFGAQFAGGTVISKSRFDKLPAEVQKAFVDAGAVWQAAYAKAQSAAVNALMQKMVEAGAKVTDLNDLERKRWADSLGPVAKNWAADAQAKGLPANEVLSAYIDSLQKAGTSLPRDWSK
ncbi:MAG: C4-dicarboxylate TRAP transporter substrate-binding protein [Rhodoferax sp.]|nr:C4-dicarboxylate TRAP transporter substrate-binding protein [Rhodoferax sp.]